MANVCALSDAQTADPDIVAELRTKAARVRAAIGHVLPPDAVLREERAAEEIEDLRASVVAFGGPWAVMHARTHGLPDGHLFGMHYDILERAGARMDDFTRSPPRPE